MHFLNCNNITFLDCNNVFKYSKYIHFLLERCYMFEFIGRVESDR